MVLPAHRVLFALALTQLPAAAQRLYVDSAGPPGGDGLGWSTPYTTIQQALATATNGTDIWIAAGTYTGGINVPAGVHLFGGFARGASSVGQARPQQQPTILDAQNAARVATLGDGASLDGLVLRNGNAQAPGGGGALVDGVHAAISRCEFAGNRNAAGRGAALAVVNGGEVAVQDSVFHHNASTGHTIDVDLGGRGDFDHITVVDNPHNGLHMQGGAVCSIRDSIFARNQGRGICDVLTTAPNQPTLQNCLFWQNRVSLVHVHGTELTTIAAVNALPYATANIAADPRFAGASDYRLLADSGAIDRGRLPPTAVPPRLDLGGNPRALDGDLDGTIATDIGAHEFSHVALTVSGARSPGSQLSLSLDGTAGLLGGYALLLPAAPVAIPPFGPLWGTAPAAVLLGALPATGGLPVPAAFRGDVVAQPFALWATGGNLGNPIDIAIR